ncbi:hypothetical protein E2C01_085176 [Portunus trituberculatus]|uniref:Uncharacterized protein n=1 Tax=Portunus trituberculatus TaxID=210409 RepID=A0A5B7J1X2_PORTR|nr:hypothetical protein [Portunus trituberculatus]
MSLTSNFTLSSTLPEAITTTRALRQYKAAPTRLITPLPPTITYKTKTFASSSVLRGHLQNDRLDGGKT